MVRAQDRTAGRRRRPKLRLTDAGRRIIRPRAPLSVAEWARQRLLVTEGPLVGDAGMPVPWSSDAFPPQQAVIDSIDDTRWAKTVLLTAPQAFGKTQCAALPTLLHALDHRRCAALYVAGNANLGNTQWHDKIEPAIARNPELAGLLFDNPDAGGDRLERRFTNGSRLHVAGAESVGNLSAKTIPVVICDDVQSYGTLPKHGHPADYATTRAGAYASEKITLVYCGTAGRVDDWLWRTLEASAFFCPFLPCRKCGIYQLIEFDRWRYHADDVEATLADTWMECANSECDHRIRFEELPGMLRRHVWASMPPVPADGTGHWILNPPEGGVTIDLATADQYPKTQRNTNLAGFWASAFYWPWGRTWGELAADYLARGSDPDKLKDHQQNIRAIGWKDPEVDEELLTEEEIAGHQAGTYAAGTVPAAADLVVVTVDVQSGYVYYLVRAWKQTDGTSWLIDLGTRGKPIRGPSDQSIHARRLAGISAGLDAVDQLGREGWDVVADNGEITGRIHPSLILVDRGFEPEIVAGWWVVKSCGRWRMIRGARSGDRASLWPPTAKTDGRGRPWRPVDVNAGKHLVRRLLRIAPGEPGYCHLPDGLAANTLRAYARHMTAERWNRERKPPRWEPVKPGARRDWWDCEVYQVCAAYALRVGLPVMERRRNTKATSPLRGRRRLPAMRTPSGRPFGKRWDR